MAGGGGEVATPSRVQ